MTSLPEGWYDDGSGRMRWWTGREWSERMQIPAPTPSSPKRRPRWPWFLGGALLLIVVLGIVGVVLLAGWIGGLISSMSTPSAAVLSLNEAIETADCELYFSVTSDDFRAANGVDDCDAFDEGAAITNEGTSERTVRIINFRSVNSDATVGTEESLVDSGGQRREATRTYTLRAVDDVWQVVEITTR